MKWMLLVTCALVYSIDEAAARHRNKIIKKPNEVGDVFDVLRNMMTTNDGQSPFSDVLKTWWQGVDQHTDVGKNNVYIGYDTFMQGDVDQLSRESLWRIWEELNSQTREVVLQSLKDILIDGKRRDWRLHCADAYRMCQADTNCYVKYWNFEKSCINDEKQDFHGIKDEHSENHGGDFKQEVFPYRLRRVRRNGHRRNKYRKNTPVRLTRRGQKTMWMGKPVYIPKQHELEDSRRHFSMKTRSNKCSSKCVDALIMLNSTVYGSLLARCDCREKYLPTTFKNSTHQNIFLTRDLLRGNIEKRRDSSQWEEGTCRMHQDIAQECRPRKFPGYGKVVGCMEARVECEKNKTCHKTQTEFLSKCSEAINGARCSPECEKSAMDLSYMSRFASCVCDGIEGPTCRQIRNNIKRLCSSQIFLNIKQDGKANTRSVETADAGYNNNNISIQQTASHITTRNDDGRNNCIILKPNPLIIFACILYYWLICFWNNRAVQ